MTTAGYWRLGYANKALWQVILISLSIASLAYCLAVPANWIEALQFTALQLKTIQGVVSLVISIDFIVLYLK